MIQLLWSICKKSTLNFFSCSIYFTLTRILFLLWGHYIWTFTFQFFGCFCWPRNYVCPFLYQLYPVKFLIEATLWKNYTKYKRKRITKEIQLIVLFHSHYQWNWNKFISDTYFLSFFTTIVKHKHILMDIIMTFFSLQTRWGWEIRKFQGNQP